MPKSGHVSEILERFEHANRWRDHVMVVAHRGGGMEARRTKSSRKTRSRRSERRSRSAPRWSSSTCRRSRDGDFVVLHDSWLDRSSTCKGRSRSAPRRTQGMPPYHRGDAAPSRDETHSDAARDDGGDQGPDPVQYRQQARCRALPDIVAVARDLGMADQVVVKRQSLERRPGRRRCSAVHRAARAAASIFMPIIADDAVRDPAFLETVHRRLFAGRGGNDQLARGRRRHDARRRAAVRRAGAAVAVRGDWHLWVNTYAIVNKPGGMLSGGRGDELAVAR